ncbi:MAG: tRNA (adenosine(37)-N6)-threonylcarbamoyltransferase complex transferase subunit TsaD [Proteobacteria bacterium]|nr:MAG: tRNA (adenosine(37)-N6)-threonylcarbamoyltransferase complex transferase subunit TsaD [Pseudomonadota bacterium]
MFVLGIETSCDETAACLLQCESDRVQILSEEISSQCELHQAYGGVVPELASREHLTNLPLVVDSVLSEAGKELGEIGLVGVTSGPGLKGCLLMGLSFVKALCLAKEIPFLCVNHIEGHIHAPRLDLLLEGRKLEYPYLALVVSGGHTELMKVSALGRYEVLARTIDDAAGEAFDKSANLLGFAYPGGAALASLADTIDHSRFKLPKVMRETEGFSFSGLKTAIALAIRENEAVLTSEQLAKAEMAHSIQEAIVEALCFKVKKALNESGLRRLAVTGGVAANLLLRRRCEELLPGGVSFPTMRHCMDNAAMIAYLAAERFASGERSNLDAQVHSRWPVETLNGGS